MLPASACRRIAIAGICGDGVLASGRISSQQVAVRCHQSSPQQESVAEEGTVCPPGQSYGPLPSIFPYAKTTTVSRPSKEHLPPRKKAIVLGSIAAVIALVGLVLVLVHAPIQKIAPMASRPLAGQQLPASSASRYPQVGRRYVLAPGFIICRYEQGVIDFDTALMEKNKTGEMGAITRYGCASTQHTDAGTPVLFLSQSGIMRPLAKVRLSNGNPAWVDLAALEPAS